MTTSSQDGGMSKNDSFDINELAYLDEDITPEFIEQLQRQVEKNAKKMNGASSGQLDVNMFEEVQNVSQPVAQPNMASKTTEEPSDVKVEESEIPVQDTAAVEEPQTEGMTDSTELQKEVVGGSEASSTDKDLEINKNIDDNFIKKYKAKLNKQDQTENDDAFNLRDRSEPQIAGQNSSADDGKNIEELSKGNIKEKEISQEQIEYNESLDFVDDNVKYSKYIIYINPENTEFIESLTVKERKNLINKILSEQGNLILSRKKADFIKSAIKHAFIGIITVALMVPIVYKIFNFSIETTIDNYRRSQSNFQTLYKEHGKIKPQP